MRQRDIELYMDIAERVAQQSYAVRLKVGAVFVADSGVMTIGYNGTPAGWDNCCENKVYWDPAIEDLHYDELNAQYPYADRDGGHYKLVTKPEVFHAEENILGKLLEEGVSAKGGSLFLTHSPCMQCAKLLVKAKIQNLYYKSEYRSNDGLNFLRKAGIHVEFIKQK